jgi:hypothetical protein
MGTSPAWTGEYPASSGICGWYGSLEKKARGGGATASRRGAAGPVGPGLAELGLDLGLGAKVGSGEAPARLASAEVVMAWLAAPGGVVVVAWRM